MPSTATPTATPKRGSAMDRLQSDLRKKAGVEEPSRPAAATPPASSRPSPAEAPAEAEPTSPAPASPPHSPEEAGAPSTTTPPATAEATDPKKGKTSPWKLVDEFKKRATEAEAQLLEARKGLLPENDRKAFTERVQKAEARAKELEDEIRFVNYQKSSEYLDKYQRPYEDAWKRTMADVSEVAVMDPTTGQPRAATAQDILELVNLPLGEAMQVANQKFGDLGSHMMTHRNSIRQLWDEQRHALEDAKKNGSTRDAQRHEQITKEVSERERVIKETWDRVNAAVLEDPNMGTFFKPREGNQDWNTRLEKGFALVNEAWAVDVKDPRLTHEQRLKVVQAHAAVRNRAAGWGALRWENSQLKKELETLRKENAEYKQGNPPAGGSNGSTAPASTGSAWDRVKADLRKKAGM